MRRPVHSPPAGCLLAPVVLVVNAAPLSLGQLLERAGRNREKMLWLLQGQGRRDEKLLQQTGCRAGQAELLLLEGPESARRSHAGRGPADG